MPRVLNEEEKAIIVKLSGEGKSVRAIARLTGMSASTVSKYVVKPKPLTVKTIRKIQKQLMRIPPYTRYILPESEPRADFGPDSKVSDVVHLDTNGVVVFPGSWMHPESFRFIVGEDAYQELLKRPRVQSEYDTQEQS